MANCTSDLACRAQERLFPAASPSSATIVPPSGSALQSASNQSEHARQIDVHRDRLVENGHEAGNGLADGADTEDEAVAFPAFAAGAGASRKPRVICPKPC